MTIKGVQPGRILTITAGGAVASGSVQEVGSDFIGVALDAASGSGVTYPLALEGVFTVGKKTGETWAVGDKVWWDSGNSWASKTYVAGAADAFLGVATAVAGSSATTGNAKLRGGAESDADLDELIAKSIFTAANQFISSSASATPAIKTASQTRVILATTSEAEGDELLGPATVGADRLVSGQLVGTQVATVANDAVIGGIPVVFNVAVPAGAGDTDVVMTHKVRVLSIWPLKTVQAGLAGGTLTVKNGANAISNAITWDNTVADKTLSFAGTIDDAYHEIAAAGTLRITTSQGQSDGIVTIVACRVA